MICELGIWIVVTHAVVTHNTVTKTQFQVVEP